MGRINEKIIELQDIKLLSRRYKAANQTIVFTNGCFDILHAGHVMYLNEAAELGDILILGMNSDRSVKQIKGDKRPVIGQEHRSLVIAALGCIDHVVLFDEPDAERLIHAIVPDVLVKGADWAEDRIIGSDFVKQNGGDTKRIQLEPDISTTTIIRRIGRIYYNAP